MKSLRWLNNFFLLVVVILILIYLFFDKYLTGIVNIIYLILLGISVASSIVIEVLIIRKKKTASKTTKE